MAHNVADELGSICWSCLYREVASHFEGDVGTALFDYYDAINWEFFGGKLPHAFLLTALTAYGSCIGQTKTDLSKNPIILIHPSLKTEKDRFYVVLHEAIHVNVKYNLQETAVGQTSHSNEAWISEVNRIARMLGYDVTIGYNKVARIKDDTPKGKVQRRNTGNVSYACSYGFPHPLEKETGQQLPPIEQWLNRDVTGNYE